MNGLSLCVHACCNSDTLCSIDLITRQHPYLNFGGSYLLNSFKHFVLQLILNPGYRQKLHTVLNGLNRLLHDLFPVVKQGLGMVILESKIVELLLFQLFLGDH